MNLKKSAEQVKVDYSETSRGAEEWKLVWSDEFDGFGNQYELLELRSS